MSCSEKRLCYTSRMKTQLSPTPVSKLNPAWVRQNKREFDQFLRETRFPEPVRNGTRGSRFTYPESLILFIAVFSVRCKVKSYQGIHRLVIQIWPVIRPAPDSPPISESQLRDRLKKIRHSPRRPATFISDLFPDALADQSSQRR